MRGLELLVERPPRRRPPSRAGIAGEHHGACLACGKARWPTRKAARKAARVLFPGEHFTEYPCGDAWHYGHTPAVVLRGVADRRTLGIGRRASTGRNS